MLLFAPLRGAAALAVLWLLACCSAPVPVDAVAPGDTALAPARRMVAEWEPALGAMIAWPLTVPHRLAIELARDSRLYTLCADAASVAEAREWYARWGIDLERVEFLVVPQSSDASWIRDYGPHTVVDDHGNVALADARYELATPFSGYACDDTLRTPWNGGFQPPAALLGPDGYSVRDDDAAPRAIASALGLRHLSLPFALTGGNIATDGHGFGISTCVLANENRMLGLSDAQFRDGARELLGLKRYAWISNFERRGIQHVDCLLKLLDGERMLVARPPADHPSHAVVERIVEQELRPLHTRRGRPFEILRIDTARYDKEELTAYTNALILNDVVYVPLFSIAADEQALATWRAAMPRHVVKGFTFVLADEPKLAKSTAMYRTIGWNGGDALHCRTRAVWDVARIAQADPQR